MKTTLYIQHLNTADAETAILKRLSANDHIKNISFKLPFGTITFDYEIPEDIKVVKQALSEMGFPPFGEINLLRRKKNLV